MEQFKSLTLWVDVDPLCKYILFIANIALCYISIGKWQDLPYKSRN